MAPKLVLTGQQALEVSDFDLGGYPHIQLSCPGRPHPHAHVRDVRRALAPRLCGADLVVVQGDTSSALGGALAAFDAAVAVAHVEAGLRTHDPLLPWPEERYRTAIDARAELLFAPTPTAVQNLIDEGVRGEISLTGNTGIDALVRIERSLPSRQRRNRNLPQLLVTCHRRESWGQGLESIAAALVELASDGVARVNAVLHPNPRVAAAMRRLLEKRNVGLLDPCPHAALVERMRDADLILSDSGGIQEEAPALGKPLLVLRDKTERPEAIATGNARLVGTETARIVDEVRRIVGDPLVLAAMSRRAFPFGDGRSAWRIAALIQAWLERKSGSGMAAAGGHHG